EAIRVPIEAVMTGLVAGLEAGTFICNVFTNSAGTSTPGKKGSFGLAGQITILTIDNTATSFIDDGAHINTHFGDALPPGQDVKVHSLARLEMVDMAEQLSILAAANFGGGATGDVAIGGSLAILDHTNQATAYIGQNAIVNAGRDV